MCDSEARVPRALSALTAEVRAPPSSSTAAGGTAGTGQGAGNTSGQAAPAAALLACGRPPTGLVRETFSFAINICQVSVDFGSFCASECASLFLWCRYGDKKLLPLFFAWGGGWCAACVKETDDLCSFVRAGRPGAAPFPHPPACC